MPKAAANVGTEKPPRPRITKRERQRQLIACAKRVFVERGLFATTLEVLAEAAGVTERLVAKHFADDMQLMLALLQEVRKSSLERWHSEAAALPDPLSRLNKALELFLSGARSDAIDYAVLRRALADWETDTLTAALRTFFLEIEAFFAALIAEGQQAGVFRRPLDPHMAARKLLHAGLGQLVAQPLQMPPHPESDSLGQAAECLLTGLMKTDV